MVVGYAGYGIYELVVSLNDKAFKQKNSPIMQEFKLAINE